MIHHEEPLKKDYDPKLIRRILAYLKPYWLLVSLSILCILLSTGSQLLLPVIIQRAVDEDLRPSWVRGNSSLHEEVLKWDERVNGQEVRMDSSIYYPENLAGIFFRTRDPNLQLYFLIPREGLALTLITSLESVTEMNTNYLAISEDAYKTLSQEDKQALRLSDWGGIQQKALFFLALLLSGLVFNFFQLYLMALAGQNVMKDLRMDLYKRTSHQRLQFLQNQQVGRLVTRVSNDVETINELFTSILSAVVADIVMMAGVIITLFLFNQRLGLVSLAILPPVALLLLIFRKKARESYRKVRKWVSAVNAYISEHLAGVGIVQAFAREVQTIKEFARQNKELFKANLGEFYVFTIFRPFVDLLSITSVALIIYVGASSLLRGLVSLGVLIAFINLIERFYMPVQDMAEKFTLIQSAMAGGERVFALLDEDHLEPDEGNSLPTDGEVQGTVELCDVHFAYTPGEPVLRGISFKCQPGERIAIVGPTGSGKTTIANIITRLWEIDSGSINIDGTPIKNIPPRHLRSFIQIIQQDVSLFHLTVRENLLLGREMDDEQIFAVLDQVEAGDFIRALPAGINTMVSENAANFSTGQLQLLSFARLLIQNPRIVIMDEATANIDTGTEKKIQHAIDRILKGRTSIVIAHRLSTVKEADKIIVLRQGQIAESGNHEELIKAQGIYHALLETQFSQNGA